MVKNILIIGAGKAGKYLAQDIEQNHKNIKVVGFVDDNDNADCLGKIVDINKIVAKRKIEEIIIAIPSAKGNLIRDILLNSLDNNVPIKIVPRTIKMISANTISYSDIQDITTEDLIGTHFVKEHVKNLKKIYKGKVVLITGGSGSIGSKILYQLIDLDVKKVILFDSSEYLTFITDQKLREKQINPNKYRVVIGSTLNKAKLENVIKQEKPDVIFHAAAYKHVYLMEDNIDEAIFNNLQGTKNLIDCAIEQNVPDFVFMSTDKVVNPTSIMGSTKKLAEYYIKSVNPKKTRFNIVRFGNVINSNGSVLPLFEYQIQKYKHVTITHKDIKRFFMSKEEAASLVITSLTYHSSGEIFILNMGELINIEEIAKALIRSKNLMPNKDIEIQYIGLKKGEKMIEELFTDSEKRNMELTQNEHIYRLKNFDNCKFDINEIFKKFINLAKQGTSNELLRKEFEEIFPSLRKDNDKNIKRKYYILQN